METSKELQPNNLLAEYKTIMPIHVQWGDQDAAKHVNNAMYLRYAETARIAYFHELGYKMDLESKIAPILAEINVQYKTPVTFPDTLWAGTRTIGIPDEFTILMETILVSEKTQRIATKIVARIINYDYSALKKAPTPTEFLDKLRLLDNI